VPTPLTWNYERDACWGPSGEPLLSAWLRNDDLMLRLRNSRQFGLEAVVGIIGGGSIDDESPGAVMKLGWHGSAPQPLAVRVQSGRELAFVEDVRALVAQLNCANRLQLHVRPRSGGVWWTLDASFDDLRLERLLEPDSGILLRYASPPQAARARAAPAHRPQPRPAAAEVSPARGPEADAAAQLIGAMAPVAAWAAGAKLARAMFGPDKHR
jgi:hypothetical protein